MEPVRVTAKVTVKDDIGVYCKKGYTYNIISYDLDNGLMTIEGENDEWLSTRIDDPDFLLLYEEEEE